MARRAHQLWMLAARALTTPPASRLGPPAQRSARQALDGYVRCTNVRRRERARYGGCARRRDRHVRGQHPRSGRLLSPRRRYLCCRVLLLALSANVFEAKDAAASARRLPRFRNDALALALAVAGAPVGNGFEFITDPSSSRRRRTQGGGFTEENSFELISGDVVDWRRIAVPRKRTATADARDVLPRSCLVGILVGALYLQPDQSHRVFDRSRRHAFFELYVALASPSCSRRRSPSMAGARRAARAQIHRGPRPPWDWPLVC